MTKLNARSLFKRFGIVSYLAMGVFMANPEMGSGASVVIGKDVMINVSGRFKDVERLEVRVNGFLVQDEPAGSGSNSKTLHEYLLDGENTLDVTLHSKATGFTKALVKVTQDKIGGYSGDGTVLAEIKADQTSGLKAGTPFHATKSFRVSPMPIKMDWQTSAKLSDSDTPEIKRLTQKLYDALKSGQADQSAALMDSSFKSQAAAYPVLGSAEERRQEWGNSAKSLADAAKWKLKPLDAQKLKVTLIHESRVAAVFAQDGTHAIQATDPQDPGRIWTIPLYWIKTPQGGLEVGN